MHGDRRRLILGTAVTVSSTLTNFSTATSQDTGRKDDTQNILPYNVTAAAKNVVCHVQLQDYSNTRRREVQAAMNLLLRQAKRIIFLSILCLLLYMTQCQSNGHRMSDVYKHGRHRVGKSTVFNATLEVERDDIDWDQYKYVQIVSNVQDLCSAVMTWAQIEKFGSRAGRYVPFISFKKNCVNTIRRVMIHPASWSTVSPTNSTMKDQNTIKRLLEIARLKSYVDLIPYASLDEHASPWMDPDFGSLLAFNYTQSPTGTNLTRLLVLSPALSILAQLDEIFVHPFASTTEIVLPYLHLNSTKGWQYTTSLMLLKPSTATFSAISSTVQKSNANHSSLAILSKALDAKAITSLPSTYTFPTHYLHTPPPPQSQSFTSKFLPSKQDILQYILADPPLLSSLTTKSTLEDFSSAKILHFLSSDDEALPKPWIKASQRVMNQHMPDCRETRNYGFTDCRERMAWFGVYREYWQRRREVCGGGFGGM